MERIKPFRKNLRPTKLIADNKAKEIAKYALDNFVNRDLIYEVFQDYSRASIKRTLKKLGYTFLGPVAFKVYYLRFVRGYSLGQTEKILNYERKNLLRCIKNIQKKIDESKLSDR